MTVNMLFTIKAFIFRYKRILVIVSHSQDFLNGVCTNIIHMQEKILKYYGVSLFLLMFKITLFAMTSYSFYYSW